MSKFLRWIVNIVLIVAILVACGLLIPPLAGITTVIVDDVDMPTNLSKGSVTYGMSKKVNELTVGDDVIIQDSAGDYVYRLKEFDASSGQCELEDIKSTDGQMRSETITKEIPKVLFTVPFIGYVTMAMKSNEGLIIIGMAIIFIIILFILSELWKKDVDEDNEDEDETKSDVAPVNMSAHILEKVSSEIGSEISNVIAQDTEQVEVDVLADQGKTVNNETMGDTVPLTEAAKELEAAIIARDDKEAVDKDSDFNEVMKEKADIIKATVADRADDSKETVTDKVDDIKAVVADKTDDIKEAVADKVDDVKEVVVDKTDDIKETVADKADDAQEVVADKADAAQEVVVDKADDTKEAAVDKADDIKEAVADKADDTKETVADEIDNVRDESHSEISAEASPAKEIEVKTEQEENLEPVEMAMPTHTAEALIQIAKEAGLEPDIQKDEDLGITILDYSKVI